MVSQHLGSSSDWSVASHFDRRRSRRLQPFPEHEAFSSSWEAPSPILVNYPIGQVFGLMEILKRS